MSQDQPVPPASEAPPAPAAPSPEPKPPGGEPPLPPEVIEKVVIGGDLAELSAAQRADYYSAVCRALGLNPLTKPFEYLTLNGKLRLYALRDCADQLRRLHGISIYIANREKMGDIYVVTARAKNRTGREDESTGAVPLGNLRGDALANALMKAECVPLTSEILTRNGFKFYDELTLGEEVLAYDVETDRCLWTLLRHVTVYDAAPIINFGTKLHTFQCTPDHSWAVHKEGYQPDTRGAGTRGPRGAYRSRTPDRFLCQAMSINTGHRVVLSVIAEEGDHPLTPTEAAILGWVMCDGSIKRAGGSVRLGICQSKPERVEEIRELLRGSGMRHRRFDGKPSRQTFPSGRDYDCLPQTWFYLPAPESRALLMKANLGSPADLPALVTQLSHEARQAMLASMMAADGDARGVFGKKRKPGVMEAWQILATLEGYALGKLGLSSAGDVPLQRLRKQRYLAGNNLERSPAGMSGMWCPTTDYGTCVIRQNGMVTITGNTKAKRRVTLSIAGLGWLDETELDTVPAHVQGRPDRPVATLHDPSLDETPGARRRPLSRREE
jgi:hypothetical protein